MGFWSSMAPMIGMGVGGAAGSIIPGAGTMAGMAAGGALGGAIAGQEKQKHDQEIEDAQRKLQSNLAKFSYAPGTIQGNPNAIPIAGQDQAGQGALLSGITGASFGQSFANKGPAQPGLQAQAASQNGVLYGGGDPYAQGPTWQDLLKAQGSPSSGRVTG